MKFKKINILLVIILVINLFNISYIQVEAEENNINDSFQIILKYYDYYINTDKYWTVTYSKEYDKSLNTINIVRNSYTETEDRDKNKYPHYTPHTTEFYLDYYLDETEINNYKANGKEVLSLEEMFNKFDTELFGDNLETSKEVDSLNFNWNYKYVLNHLGIFKYDNNLYYIIKDFFMSKTDNDFNNYYFWGEDYLTLLNGNNELYNLFISKNYDNSTEDEIDKLTLIVDSNNIPKFICSKNEGLFHNTSLYKLKDTDKFKMKLDDGGYKYDRINFNISNNKTIKETIENSLRIDRSFNDTEDIIDEDYIYLDRVNQTGNIKLNSNKVNMKLEYQRRIKEINKEKEKKELNENSKNEFKTKLNSIINNNSITKSNLTELLNSANIITKDNIQEDINKWLNSLYLNKNDLTEFNNENYFRGVLLNFHNIDKYILKNDWDYRVDDIDDWDNITYNNNIGSNRETFFDWDAVLFNKYHFKDSTKATAYIQEYDMVEKEIDLNEYNNKKKFIYKTNYFASKIINRSLVPKLEIRENITSNFTELSFYTNNKKINILPYSSGAVGISNDDILNFILENIKIKNDINSNAIWSDNGKSVTCFVNNKNITVFGRQDKKSGGIVYIPSGNDIYAIALLDIPLKYKQIQYKNATKNIPYYDFNNVVFIYKKFLKSDFSELLDINSTKINLDIDELGVFDELKPDENNNVFRIKEDYFNSLIGKEISKNGGKLKDCNKDKYIEIINENFKVRAASLLNLEDIDGVLPNEDFDLEENTNTEYDNDFDYISKGQKTSRDFYNYHLYNKQPKYIYFKTKDDSIRVFVSGATKEMLFVTNETNTEETPSPTIPSTPEISSKPAIEPKLDKPTDKTDKPKNNNSEEDKPKDIPTKPKEDTTIINEEDNPLSNNNDINILGTVMFDDGTPYKNLDLSLKDISLKTDERGKFNLFVKYGLYNFNSDLFDIELNVNKKSVVKILSVKDNITITKTIKPKKIEFKIICKKDKPTLPKTGGTLYNNYAVSIWFIMVIGYLFFIRKKKI